MGSGHHGQKPTVDIASFKLAQHCFSTCTG